MRVLRQAKSRIIDHIDGYFERGIKAPDALCVGVEWEKIGVDASTGRAIPYSGPRGVRTIFDALSARFGWRQELAGGIPIALSRGRSSITLEPGGQIELSGQTYRELASNAGELYGHLDELKAVSEPLGIAWLGIGMQPVSGLSDIEWVPKERYRIMRTALAARGTLSHAMMKQTASIQVSIDYTSEADAVEKLRLAMGLSPILSAMFANSPLSDGALNGCYSRRALIWQNTAPERTGVLEKAFEGDFTFADYTAYALDVPLLFIVRDGIWHAVEGLTFGEYIRLGWRGIQAEPEDWDLHLSTLFTEARLKHYLEIRSIDCQQREMGLAVPALIKGLFYSQKGRQEAWRWVEGLSVSDRRRIRLEAPKKGLKTLITGRKSIGEASLALVELAEAGLEREGEGAYLAPIKALLKDGRVPADRLIGCFSAPLTETQRVERLLRCAAV